MLRIIEWGVVKETQSLKRCVYKAEIPYYVLISSHHDTEREIFVFCNNYKYSEYFVGAYQ